MKIIAEAGINFNSFSQALYYCKVAKDIGADIIKFQVTDIEKTCNTPKLKDRIMLKQLDDIQWQMIMKYCDKIGIEFLATPSSLRKLMILMASGMTRVKIGSDRAAEKELVQRALSYNVPVIVSNGLHKINYNNKNLIKMYCVSKYPACSCEYQFDKIKGFDGLSDHTLRYDEGWCKKIKKKQFKYYEKHFKLDDDCIDARASLNKDQFKELIYNLRN
jgi:sialic acid synthase SpsE